MGGLAKQKRDAEFEEIPSGSLSWRGSRHKAPRTMTLGEMIRLSILANLANLLLLLLVGNSWRGDQGCWLPEFCIT
jgi:hypothetical protein